MIQKVFSVKFFQIYFYICLIAVEFIATTTDVHIVLVESMWDKSNHFIAFLVLYLLFSFAYQNLTPLQKTTFLLYFGIQIELLQEYIGRSLFSGLDILADSVGIIMGIVTMHFLKSIIVRLK